MKACMVPCLGLQLHEPLRDDRRALFPLHDGVERPQDLHKTVSSQDKALEVRCGFYAGSPAWPLCKLRQLHAWSLSTKEGPMSGIGCMTAASGGVAHERGVSGREQGAPGLLGEEGALAKEIGFEQAVHRLHALRCGLVDHRLALLDDEELIPGLPLPK